MAATFSWTVRNGSGGTRTDLGNTGNLQNFKSIDTAGISDYAANPITAGQNSFEVWLQGHWTGLFNLISGVRFWQSVAFSPSTGLVIKCNTAQVTYLQPSAGTSSVATSSIPVADPGTTNVSINGSLTGSLTSSGYSDHIVMQLQTTTAAAAGDSSLMSAVISYSES